MSAYCDSTNFKGCAQWMRIQSQEEYGHAMRLFDFMLARGGRVVLQDLDAPKLDFKSVLDVFETAFKQEQRVSKQIDDLYGLAAREKTYAAMVQLEWFISEQVEEEKTMREIVARMKMVKDDPASLLDIDRELGGRSPGEEGGGGATE
jgi:ferritin